jgi:hypothetical protein
MRWPVLADYLEKNPYPLEQTKLVDATAEIQALWQNIEVLQVIGGEGTDAALEAAVIEQCSLLRN